MSKITSNRALLIGLATVGFGVSTIFRKMAISFLTPLQYQALAGIIYALSVMPFWMAAARISDWSVVNPAGIFWVVAATLVHIGSAIVFMMALQGGNDVGLVSSLSSASPVITLMLSLLFLGEQPSLKQSVGVAIILLGVILAAR